MTKKNEVLIKWKKWNEAGFFPGIEEDGAAFEKRVEFCTHLIENLKKNIKNEFPFPIDENESSEFIEDVFSRAYELYGIRPFWVPIFFSNHQLAPWHGGCAWIFQLNEECPTAAFIQLRLHFKKSKCYLSLYSRDELLVHEIAHIGRMAYQQPEFEELFAYQSSFSKWRQYLGPLVQSSKESLFFILFLAFAVMMDFALIMTDYSSPAGVNVLIRLTPIVLIVAAFIRLIYYRWLYDKCLRQLALIYSTKIARHVAYRLTDFEIRKFAYFSKSQIVNYMAVLKDSSFRWSFFNAIYSGSE